MRFKLMPATTHMGVKIQQLLYVCMGCTELYGGGIQAIPVNTKAVWPAWEWDGNLEMPSIKEEIVIASPGKLCRATLTEGIFKYHDDCTHACAGYRGYAQPFPEWFVKSLEFQEAAPTN
jgi:hypothetical protein